MTTKLMMVFFAVLAGVMGGLTFSKRTSMRERYFDEFVRIIDVLISDIKFSQQKIGDILNTYESTSPQINKNLLEYTEFLQGGELNLTRGILTKREYKLVTEFFVRLGSLDLWTQLDELSGRKACFEIFKNDAKKKNSSFGKAFIKLGFLGGLLIGILLL